MSITAEGMVVSGKTGVGWTTKGPDVGLGSGLCPVDYME